MPPKTWHSWSLGLCSIVHFYVPSDQLSNMACWNSIHQPRRTAVWKESIWQFVTWLLRIAIHSRFIPIEYGDVPSLCDHLPEVQIYLQYIYIVHVYQPHPHILSSQHVQLCSGGGIKLCTPSRAKGPIQTTNRGWSWKRGNVNDNRNMSFQFPMDRCKGNSQNTYCL